MHPAAVFQRTDSGRTEIKTKMHGLTQSERLALIVVDGITPYLELRQKLKGLAEDRFERALNNLLQKSLIFEVLLAGGEIEPDDFDSATVDRFLHQDPLDPVTIISFDPEDDFGLDVAEELRVPASAMTAPSEIVADTLPPVAEKTIAGPINPSIINDAQGTPESPRVLTVDIYLPLERKRVVPNASSQSVQGGVAHALPGHGVSSPDAMGRFVVPSSRLPWGQIMIAAGIIIIVMSILVKLAH